MKIHTAAIALATSSLMLVGAQPARADGKGGLIGWLTGSRDFPPIENQTYLTECGSCHIAFPPGMMSAGSWQSVMTMLKNHYGDDATIKSPAASEISSYLRANAARDSADFARHSEMPKPVAGTPPRLTHTAYFHLRHHEISEKFVKSNPKIQSFANCQACHLEAKKAIFSEESVVIPPLADTDEPDRPAVR